MVDLAQLVQWPARQQLPARVDGEATGRGAGEATSGVVGEMAGWWSMTRVAEMWPARARVADLCPLLLCFLATACKVPPGNDMWALHAN